jgi:hypothetical protein
MSCFVFVKGIAFAQAPPNSFKLYHLRQKFSTQYDKIEGRDDIKNQFFRVQKNGLYGFVDSNGIELVAPQYEETASFDWTFAGVKKNGKWGAINRKGELIIPFEYDKIGWSWRSTIVDVTKDSLSAIFDSTGLRITPFEYTGYLTIEDNEIRGHLKGRNNVVFRDSTGRYLEIPDVKWMAKIFGGWMATKMGRCAIFNNKKQQLSDYIFPEHADIYLIADNQVIVTEDQPLLYDLQGNLLADVDLQLLQLNRNTIWISIPGKRGILHKNGKFIETPSGEEVATFTDFSVPRHLHIIHKKFREHDMFNYQPPELYNIGWIDINSGVEMPPQFNRVSFYKDKILAQRDDTTFIYNQKNELLKAVPFYFHFHPGMRFGMFYKDQKHGFIDSNFNKLNTFDFEIIQITDYGWILFSLNYKTGILDPEGNEILPPIYDHISLPIPELPIVKVSLKDKNGVFDLWGKEIVPIKYDSIEMLKNQNFVVKLNGKFGLLNDVGVNILPIVFDQILIRNTDDWLILQKNGLYGVADHRGNLLMPITLDSIYILPYGWLAGKKSSFYGIWDNMGKQRMPVEFQSIEQYGPFLALQKNNQFRIYDHECQLALPNTFDSVRYEQWPILFSGISGDSTYLFMYINETLKQAQPDIQYISSIYPTISFTKNGKIGLLDRNSWQELLPPKYDQLELIFSTKLYAATRQGKLIELIKYPGEKPAIVFYADSFHYRNNQRSLIQFWRNNTAYIFDANQSKEYRLEKPFDVQLLSNPDWESWLPYKIQRNFKIGPNSWILYRYLSDNKIGAYNPATGHVIPAIYDEIEAYDALGYIRVKSGNLYALFNPNGKPLTKIEYSLIYGENPNCFVGMKNGKYDVYSKELNRSRRLTHKAFDWIEIQQSYFLTRKNLLKGLVSPNGKELLPTKFNAVDFIGDLNWLGWGRGCKVGVINSQGSVIIPFRYCWIKASYSNAYIVVNKAQKHGLFDWNGKQLLPFEYDEICILEGMPRRYKLVKNGIETFFER